MPKIKLWSFVLVIILLMVALATLLPTQTAEDRNTLKRYICELQRNPKCSELRDLLISHARGTQPPTDPTEAARQHYVRANTLLRNATRPSECAAVAEEYRQAALYAPWWGEPYLKRGQALEAAQLYNEALASLRLYLIWFKASDQHDDVWRRTADELYEIEAKTQALAHAQMNLSAQIDTQVEAKPANPKRALSGDKIYGFLFDLIKFDMEQIQRYRDSIMQLANWSVMGAFAISAYLYGNARWRRGRAKWMSLLSTLGIMVCLSFTGAIYFSGLNSSEAALNGREWALKNIMRHQSIPEDVLYPRIITDEQSWCLLDRRHFRAEIVALDDPQPMALNLEKAPIWGAIAILIVKTVFEILFLFGRKRGEEKKCTRV